MRTGQQAGAEERSGVFHVALAGVPSADAPSRWARAYDLILRASSSPPIRQNPTKIEEETDENEDA